MFFFVFYERKILVTEERKKKVDAERENDCNIEWNACVDYKLLCSLLFLLVKWEKEMKTKTEKYANVSNRHRHRPRYKWQMRLCFSINRPHNDDAHMKYTRFSFKRFADLRIQYHCIALHFELFYIIIAETDLRIYWVREGKMQSFRTKNIIWIFGYSEYSFFCELFVTIVSLTPSFSKTKFRIDCIKQSRKISKWLFTQLMASEFSNQVWRGLHFRFIYAVFQQNV